jgi:hypothetical protein
LLTPRADGAYTTATKEHLSVMTARRPAHHGTIDRIVGDPAMAWKNMFSG